MFVGTFDVRYKSYMYEAAVLASLLDRYLPDRFKEWLALDVADGATYLNDGDVDVFLLGGIDEALNLVNDVRNDLDGFAKIFATSFFG